MTSPWLFGDFRRGNEIFEKEYFSKGKGYAALPAIILIGKHEINHNSIANFVSQNNSVEIYSQSHSVTIPSFYTRKNKRFLKRPFYLKIEYLKRNYVLQCRPNEIQTKTFIVLSPLEISKDASIRTWRLHEI